jgi:hypothetical protein
MPKTRPEEKALTLSFQSFDCTLEYVPGRRFMLVRYVRKGKTFFTSCIRTGTKECFRSIASTMTEGEAVSLLGMGISML